MSARWSGVQEQRGSGCFEHLRINGSPGLLSQSKELEGFQWWYGQRSAATDAPHWQ